MTSTLQDNCSSFSDEQLLERKKSIGASECGSVLGVQGAYKTPYQVWLDKTTPEVLRSIDTVYTLRGRKLEPCVIKAAEIKWGKEVVHNVESFKRKSKPYISATPDGWYYRNQAEEKSLVQIKTSSILQEENYGLQDTADVPLNYLFQCYQEMLVTNAESIDLVVYFATEAEFDAVIFMAENMDIEQVGLYICNSNLKKYHIARNDERLRRLEEILTDFWQSVIAKKPPLINRNLGDLILEKEPSEFLDLNIEEQASKVLIMEEYVAAKSELDIVKEEYSQAREKLNKALKEGTIWHYGHISLEFKRNKPKSKTNWEALAKHSFVDKQSIEKCKEIVLEVDLSDRERLSILKGLEDNDLKQSLVDRFIKSAHSKSRPINENEVNAFNALALNCRIPPEIQMEYTTHYPGAKVLRNKKDK